ncbi:hypothetical protein [uncultured Pleomorphomonas sp.]|nr:hypothetical protein [uncultured Pleomorphomonas sp.]
MRFLAGLRLVLVAAALIGLVAGRGVVLPVVAAEAAMATVADGAHDCCGKTSNADAGKAGLAGSCLGAGCAMAAPALLPVAAAVTFAAARAADTQMAVAGLEGRSPPPLLEPPRA